MATQALEILKPALRRAGVIGSSDTPNASQLAVALDCLNGILDTWGVLPSTAVHSNEIIVTLPANTPTLTVGPGAAIDTVRPARVESAYTRFSAIDRDVDVVSKQDYDSISLKSTATTWPEVVWYDRAVPAGVLHFWPLAGTSVELHLTLLTYLAGFPLPTSSQELPRGYLRALQLAVAVEVSPEFNLAVSADLQRAADNAYRAMTLQNFEVPELDVGVAIQSRLGQFLGGE